MKDLPADHVSAPYFADIAQGPAGGVAHWLTTKDGLRIRVGHWRPQPDEPSATGTGAADTSGTADTAGTVLIFPGRTEYIEKYGPTATELTTRGFAVMAIDWRGQGLADRSLADRLLGHVERFEDFQTDVAALVAHAEALELPKPWYLLAHSMGGEIGLRAVMEGLAVEACVFTGPMWGIRIPPSLRPVVTLLSYVAGPLDLRHKRVPTTTVEQYVQVTPFKGNTLTNDPECYAFLQMHMERQPDLALGGPTIGWLLEALKDCTEIAQRPSPDLPCLTFLGTEEQIVDTQAVDDRMATWPKGRLERVPGGQHEILLEDPATLSWVHDAIAAHFRAARNGS